MADEDVSCRNCGTPNAPGRRKCRKCRRVLNPISHGERSAANSIAANARWKNVKNRSLETAKARAAGVNGIDYWLKRVDPDGEMSDRDRVRAAENARAEWFGRRMKDTRAAKRSTP